MLDILSRFRRCPKLIVADCWVKLVDLNAQVCIRLCVGVVEWYTFPLYLDSVQPSLQHFDVPNPSTLSTILFLAQPCSIPVVPHFLQFTFMPAQLVTASTFCACSMSRLMQVVRMLRSTAYAMLLVVWSASGLLCRHPYRYPRPPECSHRSRGSIKIKNSSGESVSP